MSGSPLIHPLGIAFGLIPAKSDRGEWSRAFLQLVVVYVTPFFGLTNTDQSFLNLLTIRIISSWFAQVFLYVFDPEQVFMTFVTICCFQG